MAEALVPVTFALDDVPDGAVSQQVTAAPAWVAGCRALRVELTDEITFRGRPKVDYVDQPTFLRIPAHFETGTIEVDLFSQLNGKGPTDSRAFAGVAYRITEDGGHFECVYLRPLNGHKNDPPAPRDRRAVQYFAYPGWPFDRLRDEYPDGRYEAGLDIGPSEWIALRLEVHPSAVRVVVNGVPALTVSEPKGRPVPGDVGLFVDIGTEAYFSNLRIQASEGASQL